MQKLTHCEMPTRSDLELEYQLLWEKQRRNAKRSHLAFMNHTWNQVDPYVIGMHTREICSIIDDAINKFREGISSFILIEVPFRHGKSQIVSRDLPPHFLGEFPEREVMLMSYGEQLSNQFSKHSRKLIQSDLYKSIYPDITLDRYNKSVGEWAIDENTGKAQYSGLGGAKTGMGYHLGIADDLIKNREQAESDPFRQKIWESFKDDFLTRRAPVSITICLWTPWHIDDVGGRIRKAMEEDPNFPRFQFYKFPAFSKDYPTGYLFPERFSPEWYETQKATLGSYSFSALMQCDPTPREGNQFKGKGIRIIEANEVPDGLVWCRGWDLASTEKQLRKDDPDYTVGSLVGVYLQPTDLKNVFIPHVYVKDCKYGQWAAPKRNQIIRDTALLDGAGVRVAVEGFAGYKDAYEIVKSVLKGIRSVKKSNLPGSKEAKASVLETPYEEGHIYFVRGPWNSFLESHFKKFPVGHDDGVDSVCVGYDGTQGVIDLKPFTLPI